MAISSPRLIHRECPGCHGRNPCVWLSALLNKDAEHPSYHQDVYTPTSGDEHDTWYPPLYHRQEDVEG